MRNLSFALAYRLRLYPRFDHIIDHADDILAGGFLDPFEPGRAVDLKHLWPAVRPQQIHTGSAQTKGPCRTQGGIAFNLGDAHDLSGAATVQVGAEIAIRAGALHRSHDLAIHHKTAQILADSDAAIAKGALDTESGDLQKLIGRSSTPVAEVLRKA